MRKWLRRIFWWSALGSLLVLLTFPLWFPWLGGAVAGQFGVTWEKTERTGIFRLVLHDVRYDREPVRAEVGRVAFQTPPLWLWSVWRGKLEQPLAEVSDYRITVSKGTPRETEPSPFEGHLPAVMKLVDRILLEVDQWAPHLQVGSGEVTIEPINLNVRIDAAEWRNATLEAKLALTYTSYQEDVAVRIQHREAGRLVGRIDFPQQDLHIDLETAAAEGNWDVLATLGWQGQEARVEVGWDGDDWIPARAWVSGQDLVWPAELFQLDRYAEVTGSVEATWENPRWSVGLDARAEPVESRSTRIPPITGAIRATGDLDRLNIEKLDIHSPWASLSLGEGWEIDREGQLLNETNDLGLLIQLASLPLADLGGVLALNLNLRENQDQDYEGTLSWTLEGGRWEDLSVERWDGYVAATINSRQLGDWRDPETFVFRTETRLTGISHPLGNIESASLAADWEEGMLSLERVFVSTREESQVVLSGTVSPLLPIPEIDLRTTLRLTGNQPLPYLPEQITWSTLDLAAHFKGAWDDPEIDLESEFLGLDIAPLREMEGRLQATGNLFERLSLQLAGSSQQGEWEVATSLAWEENFAGIGGEMEAFTMLPADREEPATLQNPAAFQISWPEQSGGGRSLLAQLADFHWRDSTQNIRLDLDLEWPRTGEFRLEGDFLDLQYADIFIVLPGGFLDQLEWTNFVLAGNWDQGPLHFTFHNRSRASLTSATSVGAYLEITADEDGLSIKEWTFEEDGRDLFSVEGFIPLQIYPLGDSPSGYLKLDLQAPFFLRAQTSPRARFWQQIGALAQLDLGRPEVSAELSGTLARPNGDMRLRLAHLAADAGSPWAGRLPRLSNLEIDLHFDEEEADLRNFSFSLDGQRIQLFARLPLGRDSWENLLTRQAVPDWRDLEGSLRIPRIEMDAVAAYFPQFISRQGHLQAELRFLPGASLDGEIELFNAATRPFLPMGSINQLQGRVLIRDRQLIVENLSGRIGGQVATVRGSGEWGDDSVIRYDLTIVGENIPLARQPGTIIRGDLDLQIAGAWGADQTTTISGRVNLADSFFLSEFRLQAPGSVTTPSQRPPYFSVDVPPLDEWRLDLRITGRDFLTVRSTVFSGVLGTELQLQGTLGEPEAIGQIELARGTIRLPFGRLSLQQGVVRLTEENPFLPTLSINAEGRVFGYDVMMDITGTAEDPLVLFTSTPPLSSEEILLMLTAGELPEREIEFTGQQRATRLAMYLGQNLLYGLTGDEAQSERLLIEGGRNISRQGRETYQIEYILRERLSIQAEYDEFDEVNVGFRYRLFTR